MRELDIDVVSDVVCPWCLIGTRNLDLALAAMPDVKATVRFRPFLLDSRTPDEGRDLRDWLRRKYGGDPDAMFGRVEAAARASGIPLDFSKVQRSVSTVKAHTLLRLALESGGPELQGRVARALFGAYFLEGRDVGQVDVLAQLGAAHGLDEARVRATLTDPQALEQTREEAGETSASGVTGVPFIILGGRFALSGAQPVEIMKGAIDRASASG